MAKAKEIAELDYGAVAGDGIRVILRSRFQEMRSFRDAALDWSDIEGVHDMRVASRRLRSALRDFLPFLRQRRLRRINKDLKALADALGRVRDQDVAIQALEKLALEAPSDVSTGIEQFVEERRLERDLARAELEEAVKESALEKLEDEFNAALEHGLKSARRKRTAAGDDGKAPRELSCRQAGREVIAARFLELLDLSHSLYQPHKTKPLHEMRIMAKRLRYAIELFTPCWREPLTSFAKEIAKMQNSLGELHDCDVWIAEIGMTLRQGVQDNRSGLRKSRPEKTGGASSAGQMAASAPGAQTRSAAIWLLNYFVLERAQHFRDALSRWHEWEVTGFRAHLSAAINNEPPAGGFTRTALSPAEAVAADLKSQENP